MSRLIKLIAVAMFIAAGLVAGFSLAQPNSIALASGLFFAAWGVWFYGTMRK